MHKRPSALATLVAVTSVATPPISVQGQAGLNVAAGVAGLDLRPAR